MLKLLLMACAMLPSASLTTTYTTPVVSAVVEDSDEYLLPPVCAAIMVGDHALLIHPDRTTTSVPIIGLRIVSGSAPNAWGFPTLAVPAGPHVYETAYASASGTHTVRTPCASYSSLEACARAHKRAVDVLQQVFPKI